MVAIVVVVTAVVVGVIVVVDVAMDVEISAVVGTVATATGARVVVRRLSEFVSQWLASVQAVWSLLLGAYWTSVMPWITA